VETTSARGRRRQPVAVHLCSPDGQLDRGRVPAALRSRGVRGGLRTHRSFHADPFAVWRGPAGRRRRAGRERVVRHPAGRPRDRQGGGHRRGRRAGRPVQVPMDTKQRLPRRPREDPGGVEKPVVPHWRCTAPGRGRLVLLRRPLQGRAPATRREHQLVRDRAGSAFSPQCLGVRRDRGPGDDRGRRGRGDGLRGHRWDDRTGKALRVLLDEDAVVRASPVHPRPSRAAEDALGEGAEV